MYCIEMVLMFVKVSYNVASLSFKVVLSMSNDGIWMESLATAFMTMSVETFHPLFLIFWSRRVYLSIFCWICSSKI